MTLLLNGYVLHDVPKLVDLLHRPRDLPATILKLVGLWYIRVRGQLGVNRGRWLHGRVCRRVFRNAQGAAEDAVHTGEEPGACIVSWLVMAIRMKHSLI